MPQRLKRPDWLAMIGEPPCMMQSGFVYVVIFLYALKCSINPLCISLGFWLLPYNAVTPAHRSWAGPGWIVVSSENQPISVIVLYHYWNLVLCVSFELIIGLYNSPIVLHLLIQLLRAHCPFLSWSYKVHVVCPVGASRFHCPSCECYPFFPCLARPCFG